jgi:AWS domain
MARDSPAESDTSTLSPAAGSHQDALASSVGASSTSLTPATSLADNASEADAPKDGNRRRSVRERTSIATYNDKVNAGTAVHTRRDFLKNTAASSRNVSSATLVGDNVDAPSRQLLEEGVQARDLVRIVQGKGKSKAKASPTKSLRRKSAPVLPTSSRTATVVSSSSAVLGKRVRNVVGTAKKTVRAMIPRPRKNIRKLARVVDETSDEESEESEESDEESDEEYFDPMPPYIVEQGLYYGTTRHKDPLLKKSKDDPAEFDFSARDGTLFPFPMGVGRILLEQGRDFKLPFSILNPLPDDQAPKDWHRLNKNRFIGKEAVQTWKKMLAKQEYSICVCELEDTCGEACLNRTMQYECNEENCNVGSWKCRNRPFAELAWRATSKNQYRNPEKAESNLWGEGVEVIKTQDRGYGVRAMRSFEAGQIVVEYCGEIITEDEADRRMNEDYKGKTVSVLGLCLNCRITC